MIIYVRERGQNKNISEALEINIKINRDLEQERMNKVNKIYEEIKNDFPKNEQLINKKEIINKLINNNFNKDLIKNEIKNKIAKIDKEKAEKIYTELELDRKYYLDKKEIIDIIIEKNFEKEKIEEWVEEREKAKAEQIYNKLIKLDKIDFSKSNKDNILKEIIESNCNEWYLRNLYSTDEVDRIYAELEDDYGISGFTEEEIAKEKIRELKLDRALINDWIENTLINGQ